MEKWMIKLADELTEKWKAGVDPVEQAQKDLERHSGMFSNLKFSDANKGWLAKIFPAVGAGQVLYSAVRGRNQVNQDWLKNQASKPVYADSDEETAWRVRYFKTISQGAAPKMRNTVRRDLAASYIGSKISDNSLVGLVDSGLKFVPGLHWKGWATTMTGGSAEDHLQKYKRKVADMDGADAARKAEAWMRVGGNAAGATSAAGTAALIAVLTGGASVGGMSTAGNLPTIAKVAPWATKPAQALATFGAGAGKVNKAVNIATQAAHAYSKWRPIGATLKGVGDVSTNGGQQQSNIGAVSNFVGNWVDMIPAYTAISGAATPLIGKTLNVASKTPMIGPVARGGQKLFTYMGTPVDENLPLLKRMAHSFVKFQLQDTFIPPTVAAVQTAGDVLSGEEDPKPKYWGNAGHAYQGVKEVAQKTPAGYTLFNAGEGGAKYHETVNNIKNIPQAAEDWKAKLGLQGPATPDQVAKAFDDFYVNYQNVSILDKMLGRLNPAVEKQLGGMLNEEKVNMLLQYMPEQRKAVKRIVLNEFMSHGGKQDFKGIFSDTDMTWKEKRSLLSSLIMAEDKENSFWVSNPLSQGARLAVKGPGGIAAAAVEVSPVAREAIREYGRSLTTNLKSDPTIISELEKFRGEERLNNALSEDDWRYILGPVTEAKASEQFAIVSAMKAAQAKNPNKGGVPDSRVIGIMSDMIKERATRDKPYKADLVYEIAKNNSTSSFLPSDVTASFTNMLLNGDPAELFAEMDAKQFDTVCRFFMSGDGAGVLDQFGPEKKKAIIDSFTKAAKERALGLCLENPLNIRVMASLWAMSKGWDEASRMMADPTLFWGASMLLLTGTFLIGGGLISALGEGDSDSEEDDGDEMNKIVKEKKRQERLAVKEEQNQDPYAYLTAL